jgi:hypothetical protein
MLNLLELLNNSIELFKGFVDFQLLSDNSPRHIIPLALVVCVEIAVINALGFMVLVAPQTPLIEFHSDFVKIKNVAEILHPRTIKACA